MDLKKEPAVFRIFFVYLPVIIILASVFSFLIFIFSPVQLNNPVTIEVSQGMSLNAVSKNLYDNGVITDVQRFRLLVRVLNLSKTATCSEIFNQRLGKKIQH